MINYQLLILYMRAYYNNMKLYTRFFLFKKIRTNPLQYFIITIKYFLIILHGWRQGLQLDYYTTQT